MEKALDEILIRAALIEEQAVVAQVRGNIVIPCDEDGVFSVGAVATTVLVSDVVPLDVTLGYDF